MGKMNTAERVSREMSDNFVFQRSLLAYHAAAQRIGGDVLAHDQRAGVHRHPFAVDGGAVGVLLAAGQSVSQHAAGDQGEDGSGKQDTVAAGGGQQLHGDQALRLGRSVRR